MSQSQFHDSSPAPKSSYEFFDQNRPGVATPFPSELGELAILSKADQEKFRKLVYSVYSQLFEAEQSSRLPRNAITAPLLARLREFGLPENSTEKCGDLTDEREHRDLLLHSINLVLIRNGEILIPIEKNLYRAQIVQDTWREEGCLHGAKIWSAEIKQLSQKYIIPGVSFGCFSFVSPIEAYADASGAHSEIILSSAKPLFWKEKIGEFLIDRKINLAVFCAVFGQEYDWLHERIHAMDTVFLAGQMGLDQTFEISVPEDRLAILRENSPGRKLVAELIDKHAHAKSLMADIALEYSARIGGTAEQMRYHLSKDQPDLAILAFLCMFRSVERSQNLKDQTAIASGNLSYYQYLYRGLKELGMDSWSAIRRQCRSGSLWDLTESLKLVESLYALDFYNEAERLQMTFANQDLPKLTES